MIIDGHNFNQQSIASNVEIFILFSCSLTFENELYIFGGIGNPKQIIKLETKKLQVIGSLTFDLISGACANFEDNFIYLCFHFFPESENNQCRVASRPETNFTKIDASSYDHADIDIAASKSE